MNILRVYIYDRNVIGSKPIGEEKYMKVSCGVSQGFPVNPNIILVDSMNIFQG